MFVDIRANEAVDLRHSRNIFKESQIHRVQNAMRKTLCCVIVLLI